MTLIYHIRRSDEGPLEGKAPAALLLHGWGGDEGSMAIFETAFGPGWWLVRPRAPYPVPQGGYAWYTTLTDGKPDPAALSRSLAQLIQLLDELPQRFPIDPRRWLLVGFSQGGAMAAWLALQAPERIAGLAVFSGFLPESPSPPGSPALSGLPVSSPTALMIPWSRWNAPVNCAGSSIFQEPKRPAWNTQAATKRASRHGARFRRGWAG